MTAARHAIPAPRSHRWHTRPRPYIPPWTDAGIVRQRAKVARSLACLVALQAGTRDARDTTTVQAELDRALAALAELRARIDVGRKLAEAQRRAQHLSGLLLADEGYADADTAPIPLRTAERSA